MRLSRTWFVLLALAPFALGANKETLELQRDVAMLQEQVRNLQRAVDEKFAAVLTLSQQTLESVNRTNTAVAVMENRFNEAMKQQQQAVSAPVASVGQKLDQMGEDFRAVREAVLDMNTRLGKLDAKMADLQNLVNAIQRAPVVPPPTPNGPGGAPGAEGPAAPPPGMQADTTYTNAYRDFTGGKYDLAMQEFSDFVKYFGATELAPNAQFYVGQIYYNKHDYDNALQAFDAVLERYSNGNKTPDAHYMKGQCLMQLGKNDAAAAEFRAVYNRYPDTDLAAKAKARLRDLGLPVGSSPASNKKTGKRH